jgi:spore maturation protein SpmB
MPAFHIPSAFWEPASVDTACVYAAIVFALTVLAGLVLPWVWAGFAFALSWSPLKIPNGADDRRRVRKTLRKIALSTGGPILAVLTAFVAYATFRTSNMMSALLYVSQQANAILNIETDEAAVLCVYNWGEQNYGTVREDCEHAFVTDDGRLSSSFDDVMLYVEETMLFFVEAKQYQRLYDANFYQGLSYWTSDASEDWSGAFSYYFMMREMTDAQARGASEVDSLSLACAERFTGIYVENDHGGVCENYSRFMTNLGPAAASVETGVTCSVADNRHELLNAELEENPNYCAATWWGATVRWPAHRPERISFTRSRFQSLSEISASGASDGVQTKNRQSIRVGIRSQDRVELARMSLIDNADAIAVLADLVTALGVFSLIGGGFAFFLVYVSDQKADRERAEYGTYDALDDRYIEFQRLSFRSSRTRYR